MPSARAITYICGDVTRIMYNRQRKAFLGKISQFTLTNPWVIHHGFASPRPRSVPLWILDPWIQYPYGSYPWVKRRLRIWVSALLPIPMFSLSAYHAQQDIQIKGGDEKSQARWDRCTVSVNLKLTPLKAARRTSPPWLSLCSNFSTATQASTSCSSRACLSKKDPQSTNIQMYAYRLLTLFLSDSRMCQGSRLVAP